MKKIFRNDTTKFIVRFLLLYGLLYTFNFVYTGLTVKGGNYSPFLDHHLDYISGLRNLILNTASYFLSIIGYDNYVYGHYLQVMEHNTIRMVYSCIGLNIIAMWWAFIISFPQTQIRKLIYLVTGTIFIFLLNVIRIMLVALAPKDPAIFNIPIDHHDVFNVITYGIIILFIFRVINKSTTNTTS
ncbi:MAG: archaeosortase/exosortase family protein [Chitinophagales bacterium]|nr:archaeosortase/exosortase family protein [Chitinophagales bacterium]